MPAFFVFSALSGETDRSRRRGCRLRRVRSKGALDRSKSRTTRDLAIRGEATLFASGTRANEVADSCPFTPESESTGGYPAFESAQFRDLLSLNQVKNLRCPSRTPIANAFVERLYLNFSGGTLQRECTDHFLFFNEAQLQRALKEYQTHYNRSRPHQGIDQKIPDLQKNRASRLHGPEENKVFSKPYLEGLHHDYFRAAA